jgi:hypothetical protein
MIATSVKFCQCLNGSLFQNEEHYGKEHLQSRDDIEKMEIPRLGSFDKEYGRKNGKLILPRSLWTETNKEHIDTKPLTGKAEIEVAIIGGGITGLSAAILYAWIGNTTGGASWRLRWIASLRFSAWGQMRMPAWLTTAAESPWPP